MLINILYWWFFVQPHLPIHQVNWKHTQMLVEELDVTVVDPLCNLLANLMRRPALNHIQARPSVLRLSTRRGANEEVVLELALEIVLLNMVG
jgi:hypothetical protein